MDGANSPAVMFQGSSEWRFAVDVANQPYGRGVEIRGDLDLLFLGGADDRFDGQVFLQRLPAAPVDVSNRRTDLSVRVGINVFAKEVDQSSIPLQNRQDSQVGSRRRRGEQRFHPGRELGVDQDAPERLECEP
jgi:hypothetical protein